MKAEKTLGHCEICNRNIEEHLEKRGKRLCFSCLTEEVSETGALPVFNLKNKPVQAPCAVCDVESSGSNLTASPWGFICSQCADVCQTQSGISFENLKLAAQKEWLIKANTHIMGPFSTFEVDSGLRENRFVAHDEIAKPAGRWHLVRDEDQFRLTVNEMRNRKATKRDTTQDITDSGTQTPTAEIARERSFQPSILISEIKAAPEAAPTHAEPQSSRDLVKTFVAKDNVKLQSELATFRNRRLLGVLGLLLAVGLFLVLRLAQPTDGSGSAAHDHVFQESMEAGLKAEKVGNYQKALAHYAEARITRPSDPELLLHLAPLVLIYDRQMLQAQRMFEEILRVENGANYKKAAFTGLGLIALEAHELDRAQEYFIKARSLDQDYAPAAANMAIINFFKDNYISAEAQLREALRTLGSDGAVNISFADILIAQAAAGGKNATLYSAHTLLDAYLNLIKDYEQEVLVTDARVLTLLQKYTEAAKRIERFLDVDPEQTELHIHDWAVYRGRASWGLLLDNLKKTAAELSPSARMSAAIGLALYRGREKLEGAQTIRMALQQSAQDPLLLALAGWVDTKLGQSDSGAVYIKQAAATSGNYKLPHILMARLCQERGDFECARAQWNMVLKLDSRSVEALHGLAFVSWSKDHDRVQAVNYLTQLFANDPYYIPYLNLMQEINNSQPSQGGG